MKDTEAVDLSEEDAPKQKCQTTRHDHDTLDTEAADQSEEDTPKPWVELCYDFTQTTTCHGVRFLTESSRFFLRRVTWTLFLLLATAAFMYLMIAKLMFFFEYNKLVDVAIMYNTSMKFPAVTICNENPFELTALNDLSMVDTIRGVRMRLEDNNVEIEEEQMKNRLFILDTNICSLPKTLTRYKIAHLNNIPRYVCRDACLDFYDSQCTGIFYNRDLRQCIISSYVEESVSTINTFNATNTAKSTNTTNATACDQLYKWEFYRKKRVIEQYEFLCTFENDHCEYLVNGTSEEFPTKFSMFSTIRYQDYYRIKDVTLNSYYGQMLAFVNVPDNDLCKGSLSTPFLNLTDMCLDVSYVFFDKYKLYYTTFTIHLIGEDLNARELHVHTDYSFFHRSEWNHRRFPLPSGVFKIQIKAECMSGVIGGIGESEYATPGGLAIDNLSLERCSTFLKQQCRRDAALPLHAPQKIQNLPYCPCEPDWFRCPSDGLCIPPRLTCNGHEDCVDGSDEVAPCGEKIQITCDFEDAFLCGYTVDGWVRKKVNTLHFYKHIKMDGKQSKRGHYMAPSYKNIKKGHVAFLSSPQMTFTTARNLSYRLKFFDVWHRLEVFLVYKNGYVEEPVYQSCVRPGTYSIIFRVVFMADINFYSEHLLPSVDVVVLEEDDRCSAGSATPHEHHCDLQDTSCYVLHTNLFSDRDVYQWVPKEKAIRLDIFDGKLDEFLALLREFPFILTFPAIEITRDSCLSFNVHWNSSDQIELSRVTVSIHYVTGGLDSIFHVETDVLGNRSIEIDVPASSYDALVVTTIVFTVSVHRNHAAFLQQLFDYDPNIDRDIYMDIDEISITAHSCNIVNNININVPLSVEKGHSTYPNDRITEDHSLNFVNEDLTTRNVTNITFQDRTIPDLGAFDITTFHLSSNESVGFLASTSHKLDNFLLECRWNGVTDKDCGLVKPVNTDLGVCYTFNGNVESALSTSYTGFGLSLLLNIEYYGYIKGFTNFAGVKVFLHDQNELPMVRDLGIAVSSGVQGLLSVKYSELVNIVAPWGNCSDKPSSYYENEPYTRSRCLRACETNTMIKACGCRDVYMQGPGEMCNVSTYLQCVKGKRQPINTNCSCPEPCHSQRYSADVSYAQISPSHSDSLLSKHSSFIKKQMLASAEVRHRIESRSFITTMKMLKNNIDTHFDLMIFIRESFLQFYKTSERIEQCLEDFRYVLILDMEDLGVTSMEAKKDLKLDYSESIPTEIIDKNLGKQQLAIANLLDKHLGGSLTKLDLANSANELSSLLDDIDVLIEEINTNVLQPLQTFIGSEKLELISIYDDFGWERGSLRNNTQLYINCVPRIVKESVRSFYRQDFKPCLRVEDFSSTEAKEVIIEYYDTLTPIVDDLKKKLTAKHVDFQQAIRAYQDHLRAYINMAENTADMNRDFIQSNLVMLDVFYGELRYESIIYKPAYDMPSFFSDFGGYMGLLLGCSAMTVLEVFDLLIYNALVKCKKKKKPQQKVTVSHTYSNQVMADTCSNP